VSVLETVLVFRVVRALVDVVRNAVAVAVQIHRVGAAIGILEAVLRFRLVRAAVIHVENAVAVIIRIGTAVLVLEVVEVFGIVGALIDVVLDAVAVAVADVGLKDEPGEDSAARRRTVARGTRQTDAAAELQKRVARQVQLDAANGLGWVVLGAVDAGAAI